MRILAVLFLGNSRKLIPLLCFVIISCYVAEPHEVSAPSIVSDSYWKVVTGCGYEHCGPPPVDFLVSKDLTIRLVLRADKSNQLVLGLNVIPEGNATIELDTSFMIQRGEKKYHATAYECGGNISNPLYPLFRGTMQPVRKLIVRANYECVLLFFPTSVPPVDESFTMLIPNVMINGMSLKVPEVTFRKAVRTW